MLLTTMQYDIDHTGCIEFPEFCSMMTHKMTASDDEEIVRFHHYFHYHHHHRHHHNYSHGERQRRSGKLWEGSWLKRLKGKTGIPNAGQEWKRHDRCGRVQIPNDTHRQPASRAWGDEQDLHCKPAIGWWNIENIANGTTDPKYWVIWLIQDTRKHQLQNFDQTPASKSQPTLASKISFEILINPQPQHLHQIQLQNLNQSSVSKSWQNFNIVTKIQVQNLHQTSASKCRPNYHQHVP